MCSRLKARVEASFRATSTRLGCGRANSLRNLIEQKKFNKLMVTAHRAASKVVFSGIQPTGFIHLGNYLGAVKNWV